MSVRRYVLPLLASAAVLGAAAPASAATDTTSVTITGGTLDYTTPLAAGNFPGVTLNGSQQTVTANIDPYVVTDSRGGTGGWNLTIAASQFSDGGGNTLPQGSLVMTLPPLPTTNVLENPLGVAPTVSGTLNAIDDGTTQKIASANQSVLSMTGAGKWTFTPLLSALTLTIPAATAAGTYTSTITTTLSTGP